MQHFNRAVHHTIVAVMPVAGKIPEITPGILYLRPPVPQAVLPGIFQKPLHGIPQIDFGTSELVDIVECVEPSPRLPVDEVLRQPVRRLVPKIAVFTGFPPQMP